MQDTDPSKNIAKSMIWIAWIIFLSLFVWLFQGYLDNQYNPNQAPDVALTAQGRAQVTLERNRYGHYVSNGKINQQTVTFLLDTGATNVSVPARLADKLGLESHGSHMVKTANGSIRVFDTTIEQLSIGNISLYNVAANINPQMDSNEILLGMSALKQVEFRQSGKFLYLTEQ
ncbi:TIGR02281 family clan AA aspartic protease [Thalassotalea aquiviva]|uniref:retropepsin-like aspartic protease family protein n=1 Tax=Thalassotalea aquiviva TaxID=3242415 RepID=UPI00352B08AD